MPAKGKIPKFQQHPLYGKIPWVVRRHPGLKDSEGFDLSYKPDLPAGTVRGDPSKQNLCFCCNFPMYFYVDQQKHCLQCSTAFTFTAKEQKFWYEQLGFYGTSTAIRCPPCRRNSRSETDLRRQIAAATETLRASPEDVQALIDLAAAIIRYSQRTAQGKLDEAVAAARKAQRRAPSLPDPIFWEGVGHLAGRADRASEILRRFLASHHLTKQHRDWKREAETLLGNPTKG
jgi:hypothetical protein